MFDSLGRKLSSIFQKIKSKGIITEESFNLSIREIRLALLEADVALPVVIDFIAQLKEEAIGSHIIKSISPAQMIIKIVHQNIIKILSDERSQNWNLSKKPSIILMAGLQGSGKTTMSTKLAYLFKKNGKNVLLASCDIYRPAAMEQLAIMAKKIECDCLSIIQNQSPEQIASRAMDEAKNYDTLIVDTAGRMDINSQMMDEIISLKNQLKPQEILFTADALSGQDICNTAKAFHEAIDISGICLSRVDGDGRGGAALSIKHITGCPIKVLGIGEKPEQVEYFDAKRIADRILDMGDTVSLVEKAVSNISEDEAMSSFIRMQKGLFDMNDFLSHMQRMNKMGGIGSMLSLIPGMRALKDKMGDKINKVSLKKPLAIIQSMTKRERINPDILNASRKKRIATGSGTSVEEVNKIIKQFDQMKKIMKQFGKNMGKIKF